jgi:parallel beta-helix repeat protein
MRRMYTAAAGAFALLATAAVADAATIKVAPEDDLQTAIDGASPGDTLVLGKGRFNQRATITKSLNIKGAGKKTLLDGAGLNGPIFTIADGVNGVTFTAITILFANDAGIETVGSNRSTGFLVTKSIFRGNTNADGFDVFVDDATISRNVFRANGVDFQVDGNDTLADRNSSRSSYEGFEIYGNSIVSRPVFDRTYYGGYLYRGTHEVTRAGVRRVYAPFYTGGDSMNSVFSGNRFDDVTGTGIEVNGMDHAVTGNTFTRVYEGISVSGTNHSITSNRFSNMGGGVEAQNTSGLLVAGNTFTGLGWEAIYSSGSTGLEVSGNTIVNVLDQAIYLNSSPNAEVSGNRITQANWYGIEMYNGPGSTISGNTIGDIDGGPGIYTWGSDQAIISENSIFGSLSGMSIQTGSWYTYRRSTVTDNEIRDSGYLYWAALNVSGHENSTIQGNTIDGGDGDGIFISSTDASSFLDNVVRDTYLDGIVMWSNYDVGNNILDGNTVDGVFGEGIKNNASGPGTGTIIRNNTVTGAGVQPFANGGTVDVPLSINNTPQPADWGLIPILRSSNN